MKEGDLLPETYFYSRDDTRDGLLLRMKEAMDKALDEAWRKRAAGLPLANRREALTLASIVEKETAIPAERAKVAAVYLNRLRRKMKLESDPTTIYGLTLGKVAFNRELTRADLASNSPYNTYVVTGLPPGPICNPGRASILAATNPARDRSLYFVADGQGGHAFAQSLQSTTATSSAGARSSANARSKPCSNNCNSSNSNSNSNKHSRRAHRVRRRRLSLHRRNPRGLRLGRDPCRHWSWRLPCWRPSPSPSPGSCAPTRRAWRARRGSSCWAWAPSAPAPCWSSVRASCQACCPNCSASPAS